MKKSGFLAFFGAGLLLVLAAAGTYSGVLFIAANGLGGPRFLSSWASDIIDIRDLGAVCDGTTHPLSSITTSPTSNTLAYPTIQAAQQVYGSGTYGVSALSEEVDTAAMNAAFVKARASNPIISWGGFTLQKIADIKFGTGSCLANQTVFATNIKSRAVVIDGDGSIIVGETNGAVVLDESGSIAITTKGVNIAGSATNSPNIGILSARPGGTSTSGSTYNLLEDIDVSGTFTLTPYLNLNAEDTTVTNAFFNNSTANTYAVMEDGANFSNICSADPSVGCLPVGKLQSFNSFRCIGCKIIMTGAGAGGIWQAHTHSHAWEGGYIHLEGSGTMYSVTKFFGSNAQSVNDSYVDMHFEGPSNTTWGGFLFTGATSPTLAGFRYYDHIPQYTSAAFSAASGTNTVTINDASIHIEQMGQKGTPWYDQPALYTVNGTQASSDGSWTAPGSYSGMVCNPACGLAGSAAGLAFGGSPVLASGMTNMTGLTQLIVTTPGVVYRSGVPPCQVAAPPSGVTATCHLSSFAMHYAGVPTTGGTPTGYTLGEYLTDITDNCPVSPVFRVTQVDGGATGGPGAPTGLSLSTPGQCNSIGQDPISVSGATGAGLTISGSNFLTLAAALDVIGSGYSIAPSWQAGGYATAPSGTSLLGGAALSLTSTGPVLSGPLVTLAGVVASSGAQPGVACLTTGVCTVDANATNAIGTVTETGTGSGFVLSFDPGNPFPGAPHCGVWPLTGVAPAAVTAITGTLTVTHTAAANVAFTYQCWK